MKDGQEISVYLRILVPKLTTEQRNKTELTSEREREQKIYSNQWQWKKVQEKRAGRKTSTYGEYSDARNFRLKRIIIILFYFYTAPKSTRTQNGPMVGLHTGIKINFSICSNGMCALGTVIPLSQMLITYILTLYAIRWLWTHPKTFTKLLCMMWFLFFPFSPVPFLGERSNGLDRRRKFWVFNDSFEDYFNIQIDLIIAMNVWFTLHFHLFMRSCIVFLFHYY